MSEALIELVHIDKVFGGKPVLRGLDLQVEKGETFTILGGSGSGKSVTLKLMIGLMRADRGRVIVRGRDVTDLGERDWTPVRGQFGMVFQGSALFDSLTVLENVAYPLREHTPLGPDEMRARVSQKLSLVGLSAIEDKLPAELSGGMKKRVAVARAVAMDPDIILYDEPTTGLDPANAGRIAELIASLQERLGVTSVVVTHDLALCAGVSDRIGLLHEGRLVQVATLDEARRAPSPELQDFLGPFELRAG